MNAPLPKKLQARLNQVLKERGLSKHVNLVTKHALPCYTIKSTGKAKYSDVGGTRFGGDPDLPPDMPWPQAKRNLENGGPYLAFIAQINFAEIPSYGFNTGLPGTGLLQIFTSSIDGAADASEIVGLYHAKGAHLKRRKSPPEDEMNDDWIVNLKPCAVSFHPSISTEVHVPQIRRINESIDDFDQQIPSSIDGADWRQKGIGQLLGYQDSYYGDIVDQIVLTRFGRRRVRYFGSSIEGFEERVKNASDPKEKRYIRKHRKDVEWLVENEAKIKREIKNWQQLIRIDSNFEMNLEINDADPMYVFIRKKDLAKQFFGDLACEVTQG